jgi:hypothetical protein
MAGESLYAEFQRQLNRQGWNLVAVIVGGSGVIEW